MRCTFCPAPPRAEIAVLKWRADDDDQPGRYLELKAIGLGANYPEEGAQMQHRPQAGSDVVERLDDQQPRQRQPAECVGYHLGWPGGGGFIVGRVVFPATRARRTSARRSRRSSSDRS